MTRFIAIIDYDADEKMFGAWFPDAKGCSAMGKTEEEVVAHATDALAEWAADVRIEGLDLPTPRSYVELLKSQDYDPGKGGLIATILLVVDTGKAAKANISLDSGLLASIDAEATRQGITRSAFIAAAARARINAV
jgi:predicted RNase H-like HicB family nuclease